MKAEDIQEWDKDCKLDETELGAESAKIPSLHNKYLKIFMAERLRLIQMKGSLKKTQNFV